MKLKHTNAKKTYINGIKIKKFLKSNLALFMAAMTVLSVLFSVNWLTEADAVAQNNGQTKYKTVSEFQVARWAGIQKEIFGTDGTSVLQPASINSRTVRSGNKYFNWVDTGLTAWDGNTTSVSSSSREVHTYGNITANYYVFNVDTPKKFRYVIQNFNSLVDSSTKKVFIKINITRDLDMGGQNNKSWTPVDLFNGTKKFDFHKYMYIEGNGHTIYNLKIVAPNHDTMSDKLGCGLMASAPPFMVIKNLGFMSSMMLNCEEIPSSWTEETGSAVADDAMQSGLICAYTPQKMYLYNVHSSGGYYQNYEPKSMDTENAQDILGGIGGLVGRKNCPVIPKSGGAPIEDVDIGDTFFENCSTEKLYAYAENHVGGFSSFMCTKALADEYSYGDDIPETPEQYVFDVDFVNKTLSGNSEAVSSDIDVRKTYLINNSSSYPIMLKNCSSTDCELFSVGNDSGAFISCGTGIVADNCFTNNTLYSSDNSGGFIGRVDSTKTPMIKDSNNSYAISSCFRNCYSSGIIEGKIAMGGFTGLDNSWRARKEVYARVRSKDGEGNYSTNKGATVYENCYSTAMVGMDYAGKYVGGFVGLDDNYNSSATIRSEGKNYTGNGSFYLNCYAAGEVGNILTITDTDDPNTIELENAYYRNDENRDRRGVILDYYPTGGFAGVIGLDNYLVYRDSGSYGNDPTGVFNNCYYDKQTTAMHEMAVGISDSRATYKVGNTNVSKNNTQFAFEGIEGLYTEKSVAKGVEGLTDMTWMDLSGTNSSTWCYHDEYYPQLKTYMVADVQHSDITSNAVVDKANIKQSEFYIDLVETVTSNEYSKPVLSFGGAKNTSNAVAQRAQVARAYRCSQASTATVLLDHWDIVMDTDTGLLENEGTAWQAESRNKLTQYYLDKDTGEVVANVKYYDNGTEVSTANYANEIKVVGKDGKVYATYDAEDGDKYVNASTGLEVDSVYNIPELSNTIDEWQITYTGLDQADYQFKLEEGLGAINLNYGTGGYNGGDMTLAVPKSNCTVKIRFHYGDLGSDEYYIIAEFYDGDTGNLIDSEVISRGAGSSIAGNFVKNFYVRGLSGDWDSNACRMTKDDNNVYTYTFTSLEAGTHEFKISDKGKTEWYGKDGGQDNMSLTLSQAANVTFRFDYNTKLTTIMANPQSALTDDKTSGAAERNFCVRGLNGDWDTNDCMMSTDGNTVYRFTYNALPAGTHEFKISNKDKSLWYGVNGGGSNMSITLSQAANVTFTFDYATTKTSVTADPSSAITAKNVATEFYLKGGFNGWTTDALMNDEGSEIYSYVYEDLAAGTYEFKISNFDWSENYGANGVSGGGNMSITLSGTTDVTFKFDYNTKITTVTANPPGNITNNTTVTQKVFYVRGLLDDWDGLEHKMETKDGVTYTYTYEFESSDKGTHEFKISDKNKTEWYGFDGGENNMSLTLTGAADVTFTFNYETGLTSVTADPDKNLSSIKTISNPNKEFYVRGLMDDWDGTEFKFQSEDNVHFTCVAEEIFAGVYEFKISDRGKDEWYGLDGGESNMSLELTEDANLIFTFDYTSKLTTVTSEPEGALKYANTVTIPYEGYSVITTKDITGQYDWLPSGSEKEASEAGSFVDTDGDGWYEKTFNVHKYYTGTTVSKFDKVYGYKIIKDQNANVKTRYFFLEAPLDEDDLYVEVTFHFNPRSGESYVTTDVFPDREDVYQFAYGSLYYVVGDKGLTGDDWNPSADQMTFDATLKRYTMTYQSVAAGTYYFNILGNGDWSSGIKYGDRYGNSYQLTLNQGATVKIIFNHTSGVITIQTTPEDAITSKTYVVSGTSNLTGDDESWLEHSLRYDDNLDRHYYEFKNVLCNDNYSYQVYQAGAGGGQNITFSLDSSKYENETGKSITYATVKIIYDDASGQSEVFVYDAEGNDISNYILDEARIKFYSVLGDEELTGFNWGLDTNVYGAAAEAGRMTKSIATANDTSGNNYYQNKDILWKKTFKVEAPFTRNGKTYGFKVAANGTWDSGISYGDGGLNGGNILFTVASPREEAQSCYVDIYLNETQGKVFIIIPEGYKAQMNTYSFDWYVIGSRALTSLESKKSDSLVYDTVRDITRRFSFTSGMNSEERGVAWSLNDELNTSYGFYSDVKFSLDYSVKGISSTTNFDSPVIKMEAEALASNGEEYDGDINVSTTTARDQLIGKYYVEDFAPGKRWLTVKTNGYGYSDTFIKWKQNLIKYNKYMDIYEDFKEVAEAYVKTLKGFTYNGEAITESNVVEYCRFLKNSSLSDYNLMYKSLVETYTDIVELGDKLTSAQYDSNLVEYNDTSQLITGQRHLRLIPTAYIEAGVDAIVNVVKSDYAKTNEEQNIYAKNLVKYRDKTSDNLIHAFNSNNTLVSNNKYDKYNLAFTAGYLATDKIGLGIYTNYNDQGDRDQGIETYGASNGETFRDDIDPNDRLDNQFFAMSTVFTENASYSDHYNASKNTYNNGIAVDKLMEQSSIGPAFDRSSSDDETEQGKIAQTIVKVYKHTSDGLSKVIMDPTTDAKGVYANNYRKWIGGDRQFTADDIGTYTVTFYWALSDGRYLEDSKEVVVSAITSNLEKEVGVEYEVRGENKVIDYTLTYTNGASIDAMNFSIMDIMPFNADSRIDTSIVKNEGEVPETHSTKLNSANNMTLKSVTISQSDGAIVKGLYTSTNTKLRNHMKDSSGVPIRDAASQLNITAEGLINDPDGGWTEKGEANTTTGKYANATYNYDVNNIVALALSGKVIAPNQKIVVKYAVEVDLELNDYLVNNSYYDVVSVEDTDMRKSSISNHVVTAVIGREISGYVWEDLDGDGIVDEDEPFIQGMNVKLYKLNNNNKYVEVPGAIVTSEWNGYYRFEGLEEGNYAVVFTPPADGNIYRGSSATTTGDKIVYSDYVLTEQRVEVNHRGATVVGSRNISSEIAEGQIAGTDSGLVIANRVMPSNEEVYSGNLSSESDRNGEVNDSQNYSKTNQNAGITFDSDYGINVHKTNENTKKPIVGAEFALEYKDEQYVYDEDGELVYENGEPVIEENWYAVYFEKDDEGNLINKSDNKITFEELASREKEGTKLSKDYTIVGWINNANVGCENDWQNVVEEYNFVDGKATVTFDYDSWIFLKTTDNANWYMFKTYVGTPSGTLYNTSTGAQERMYVPAGTITFYLTENKDGSLSLSYDSHKDSNIYRYVTDSNGDISVRGLDAGSYRLVELGHNEIDTRILTSAIYFDLPYKVEFKQSGNSVTILKDGTHADTKKTANDDNLISTVYTTNTATLKEGYKYYSQVSFDIMDPSTFTLPNTGNDGLFVTAILGVALLAVAAILFILSKKKKVTALKH